MSARDYFGERSCKRQEIARLERMRSLQVETSELTKACYQTALCWVAMSCTLLVFSSIFPLAKSLYENAGTAGPTKIYVN